MSDYRPAFGDARVLGMAFRLDQYAVKPAATRRFVFNRILDPEGRPATLVVMHAGESNKPYINALFKQARAGAAAGTSGRTATPAAVRESRLEDAKLFADHVIAGWENMPLDDGKPAVFSADAVFRFLTELIDVLPEDFLRLRAYCADPDNFRDPTVDPVDLGKG